MGTWDLEPSHLMCIGVELVTAAVCAAVAKAAVAEAAVAEAAEAAAGTANAMASAATPPVRGMSLRRETLPGGSWEEASPQEKLDTVRFGSFGMRTSVKVFAEPDKWQLSGLMQL